MAADPVHSFRAQAARAMILALCCAGAAVWLGWQIGWPATYPMSHPDFLNPISAMILGLAGAALWQTGRAVIAERRHRAHGVATLELDAPGHLQLGHPLSGRVRVERAVAATGPFRLVLTCHDIHEFPASDTGARRQAFAVWSAETSLPAETDARQNLRFRFALPASVGPDPVASGIFPAGRGEGRHIVYLPGARSITARNHPPVDRTWTLSVTAPTAGPGFRLDIPVPLLR